MEATLLITWCDYEGPIPMHYGYNYYNHNIIAENQYGFRKNSSTNENLSSCQK